MKSASVRRPAASVNWQRTSEGLLNSTSLDMGTVYRLAAARDELLQCALYFLCISPGVADALREDQGAHGGRGHRRGRDAGDARRGGRRRGEILRRASRHRVDGDLCGREGDPCVWA